MPVVAPLPQLLESLMNDLDRLLHFFNAHTKALHPNDAVKATRLILPQLSKLI